MQFNMLLSKIKSKLESVLAQDPIQAFSEQHPPYILFFVVSNGLERAQVETVSGNSFDEAWQKGEEWVKRGRSRAWQSTLWLRVEIVHSIETLSWKTLKARLNRAKRNYFRFGLALSPDFKHAMLEHELYANAILYNTASPVAEPNAVNLKNYAKRRYGVELQWPTQDNQTIWRFKTRAVFTDGKQVYTIEAQGRNSGYRIIDNWGIDLVTEVIQTSTSYLANQVQASGKYHYGWFPCFDRPIPTYNALRHASSTYALLEGWELSKDKKQKRAIDNALDYLTYQLIKKVDLPTGEKAAFLVDVGDEIKLGGNAVCILAYAKYTEITGDNRYLDLMEQLALGILFMQKSDSGQYVHVLNYPDLSVKAESRIIYYDGEAAFGLMRLYGLTKDPRWLASVEKAFEYFIEKEHWKAHDHWLSYCVNELTFYKPDPKYYQFGLDNVRDHLDFVLNRITTYPTLLELMMAAQRMLERMQQDPQLLPLLDDFDIDKFYKALEHRARYLMNGFFYPEVAMFFKNPARILGGFFIRHHTFRVRIDDVEHYLSGYVAYRKYLKKNNPVDTPKKEGPIVAFGGDVNLGRRQHYRTVALGTDKVLDIPSLKEADLSIVNLECVISNKGVQGIDKGEGGPYYYRARPEMVEVLVQAGVDVVATANNHSGDYGSEALIQQLDILDVVGIGHVGSGKNINEAFEPIFRTVGNVKVAIFSIDSTQVRFAATKNNPGIAYLPIRDPLLWSKTLEPLICKAKEKADVVLVVLHWGSNLAKEPTLEERLIAKNIINSGADAILGCSAHILQGIEIYKNKPIIYDAGDLLFDAVRRDFVGSAVFELYLSTSGISAIHIVPVGVGFGITRTLEGKEAREVIVEFQKKSSSLSTNVYLTKDNTGFISLDIGDKRNSYVEVKKEKIKFSSDMLSDFILSDDDLIVKSVPDYALINPVDFGDLKLLGLKVWPKKIVKREMVFIECYWKASIDLKEDYRIQYIAKPIVNSRMSYWGKAMDHDPCDWMIPTSKWKKNFIYKDLYGIRPPYLKDWENVPLQVEIIILKNGKKIYSKLMNEFIDLDVSEKKSDLMKDVFNYKKEAPLIVKESKNNQTWTADQLEEVTGGVWIQKPGEGWYVQSVVAGVSHIDMLPKPTLFIAHDSFDRIRHESSRNTGKNIDRHKGLENSYQKLAGAVVSKINISVPKDFPLLYVKDPIKEFINLGLVARDRYKGHVIAITGSVGKSTLNSMLKSQLSKSGNKVLSSIDNYNSRVGAPGILASLSKDYFAVVIEMAQSALSMKRGPITQLIKPTICVVNSISPAHMERHQSLKSLALNKSKIFFGAKSGGLAVINRDIPYFKEVCEIAFQNKLRVVTYGENKDSSFRYVSSFSGGFCFQYKSNFYNIKSKNIGKHIHINSLAVIAILNELSISWMEAGFEIDFDMPEGRGDSFYYYFGEANEKRAKIINHAYNAAPASMEAALHEITLETPNAEGRKVVILGDMMELGEKSDIHHKKIFFILNNLDIDLVLLSGKLITKNVQFLEKDFLVFDSFNNLFERLPFILRDGDIVMAKGSNFTGIMSFLKKIKNSKN